MIKKSAFFAARKAVEKQSGLSGLDMDMGDKLNLIEFERIKGGKPFDFNQEWYKSMLDDIQQQ